MANILHADSMSNRFFLDVSNCILVDVWLEFIRRDPFDITPALVNVIVLQGIDSKQLA